MRVPSSNPSAAEYAEPDISSLVPFRSLSPEPTPPPCAAKNAPTVVALDGKVARSPRSAYFCTTVPSNYS